MDLKMKFKTITTVLIISFILSGCAKEKPGDKPKTAKAEKNIGIILTPNTSLRIDPLIFSSRITQMKKGQAVEIQDRSMNKKRIGRSRNYWYKIKLENGISGWTYGQHIKIIKNSNREDVDKYLSKFWEKETEELGKDLHGKWWSVNRFGDFTYHCLEIYKDGKYKSYYKKSKKKIEGEYNFNFNEDKIVFLKGTSFGEDLNYIKRGKIYSLQKNTEKKEIRFKKININPESDQDEDAEKKDENGKTKTTDGSKTK